MNCIAIDDEPLALEIVEDYIKNISFLNLKCTFRSAIKGLEYLQNNEVNLIFLDINIPNLNGIQLMKLLKNDTLVIFTTAYPQYAVQSYELNAVDYLLKPFEFDRFLKASMRAKELYELKKTENKTPTKDITVETQNTTKKTHIFIKSGTEIINVALSEIKYIEAGGSYVTFVTSSRNYMCLQNMNETLNMLPPEDFIRVHKSYIVSFKHIEKIEYHQIKIGNIQIPIGNTYREEFYNKLKI